MEDVLVDLVDDLVVDGVKEIEGSLYAMEVGW
jgi:hypothetical protein